MQRSCGAVCPTTPTVHIILWWKQLPSSHMWIGMLRSSCIDFRLVLCDLWHSWQYLSSSFVDWQLPTLLWHKGGWNGTFFNSFIWARNVVMMDNTVYYKPMYVKYVPYRGGGDLFLVLMGNLLGAHTQNETGLFIFMSCKWVLTHEHKHGLIMLVPAIRCALSVCLC